MNIVQAILSARSETLQTGGSTLLFNGHPDSDKFRYITGDGRKGFTMALARFITFQGKTELLAILEPRIEDWKDRYHGFGFWINGSTVHVDPVTQWDDIDFAVEWARSIGELAIFDMATGDVINVKKQ